MHRKSFSVLLFCIGLWTQAAFSTTTDVLTGVKRPTGIAVDELATVVYFVESDTGTLYRMDITPGCSPCTSTTIVNQLKSAQDVALDAAHGYAYVTSIDPLLNGALWRVDLAAKTQKLITFNFGRPRQLALDVATQSAYVTGTDTTGVGRLWKVNLTTGGKKSVITGLINPSGLTILADRTRAYVTESNGSDSDIAEIDIALGTRIRNVSTGLLDPMYLAWTDTLQTTLYTVQRGATNIVRTDVPGINTVPAFGPIGTAAKPPTGIALSSFAGVAYVTTDDKILRVDLNNIDPTNPGFISVGGVVKSDIQGGYANNAYFKDAPFGGTLNIFGNLASFASVPGVTHYRVLVSYNGQPPVPVKSSWTVSRWDNATLKWTPFPVASEGDGYYGIPSEYYKNPTAHPERFSPPFLMLQWPSGAYGVYTFTIELYHFATSPPTWNPITPAQIAAETLTLKVDNEPLTVDLTKILNHTTGAEIKPCQIVNGPGPSAGYDMLFTASDPQGHLRSYNIMAYWGKDKSQVVIPTVSYVPTGTKTWFGVSNEKGPATPSGYVPVCNCAHMFVLTAAKRTTNGNSYLIDKTSRQSITINDTGSTSCP